MLRHWIGHSRTLCLSLALGGLLGGLGACGKSSGGHGSAESESSVSYAEPTIAADGSGRTPLEARRGTNCTDEYYKAVMGQTGDPDDPKVLHAKMVLEMRYRNCIDRDLRDLERTPRS